MIVDRLKFDWAVERFFLLRRNGYARGVWMGLCAGGGSSEQLLIVQTLSLAVEAAPWQVELGRGFYILSMLLCARFFDLSFPRLSSLDAVLHKYQRCGFLALVGMFFYLLVRAIVRTSLRT